MGFMNSIRTLTGWLSGTSRTKTDRLTFDTSSEVEAEIRAMMTPGKFIPLKEALTPEDLEWAAQVMDEWDAPAIPLTPAEKLRVYQARHQEILVDFDGTLCEWAYPGMGAPMPQARESLEFLRAKGLRIVVWSSRMDPSIYTEDERAKAATDIAFWMHEHAIPYDAIDTGNSGKRLAAVYVDDRAVHLGGYGWSAALMGILTILDRESRRIKRTEELYGGQAAVEDRSRSRTDGDGPGATEPGRGVRGWGDLPCAADDPDAK